MTPWHLYEALLEDLPHDAVVTSVDIGPQWTRVTSEAPGTDGGPRATAVGAAFTTDLRSRPALSAGTPHAGRPLRDVASLVTSWNLREAGVGLAALNSWYSREDVATSHGFTPTGEGLTWGQVFDPWAEAVAGRRVGVVGHFPFARAALHQAGELIILERNVQPGDYPDSACEYLLPECDLVFVSGSSLVNKTTPRLLELCAGAQCVVIGPSTPMHPVLHEVGATTVMGFSPARPAQAGGGSGAGLSLVPVQAPTGIGPGARMHSGPLAEGL